MVKNPTGRHTAPPPTQAPAVRIADLVVRRGKRQVIPGLTLTIKAGLITGLLGPSGSGKSTLMRAIVGVQDHVTGTLEVLGRPGTPALRREVGYATQAASTYADLSVRANLQYFAALYGAPASRVAEVIDAVGLTDHASNTVGNLSGGQANRASLAAALISRPGLLVLDEPTVGLDPVLRRDLWTMFRDLRDAGTTLLVSSHVMDEATQCDRLVLLRRGAVLTHTTPAELLASTGAADAESAFLALIDQAETDQAGTDQADTTTKGSHA